MSELNFEPTGHNYMQPLPFDSHALIKELQSKHDFNEKQAEGVISALTKLTHSELATKSDLKELKNELKLDIAKIETRIDKLESKTETNNNDLKHAIKEVEMRLTIRLGIMLFLAVGALATLQKLL